MRGFLKNKSIKLITFSFVSTTIVCLSGCHRGPVMTSQTQATDRFQTRHGLFGSPQKTVAVAATAPTPTPVSNGASGVKMVKSTPLSNTKKHTAKANKYVQVKNIADARIKYVPVPVPGQLMPIPRPGSKKAHQELAKKPQTPMQVVKEANHNSRIKPTEQGYFNSVMTYEYMPGAVYVLYTAPLNITDIMFQPGEKIISYSSGDTVRWIVAKTRSGSGDSLREHLVIKPQKPSLENTLLVTTDKRVYHLVVFSTHNNTYMVAVNWNYPEDFLGSSGMNIDDSFDPSQMLNDTLTLDMASLSFNYQFGMLKGDKPAWFPLRVFSSDRQTFVEFSKEFKSSQMPMLYVKTDNGQYATMVNWRLLGRFMVIDQVVSQAQLIMGIEKTGQVIVLVEQSK
jgi:type IV secretion system protein TrbG